MRGPLALGACCSRTRVARMRVLRLCMLRMRVLSAMRGLPLALSALYTGARRVHVLDAGGSSWVHEPTAVLEYTRESSMMSRMKHGRV